MIAALAGGSLPFILRTVMQPEKPEIEIGTVSFKNQMDEIIKNFVQCWPIYDLPFIEYTAEEEEKDRQKKEQEEKSAAAESKDRNHALPAVRNSPLLPHATNTFQFVSGEDMIDGRQVMEGNHVGNHVTAEPSEAIQSPAPSQHVCFDLDTRDNEPDVDIVIYLPDKHDEAWLDEWSDIVDEASSSGESFEDGEGEVFPMREL